MFLTEPEAGSDVGALTTSVIRTTIFYTHTVNPKGLLQKPKLFPACTIHNNNKILGVAVHRHCPENRCRTGIKPTCATVNPLDKSAFNV